MNEIKPPSENIDAAFQGDVSGQVNIGTGNVGIGQIKDGNVNIGSGQQVVTYSSQEIEGLRQEVRALVSALKQQVADEAPEEVKPAALEHVDELEQAITAEQPELDTIGYVKNWFAKNLPALAGAVNGLVISPIVGKLVSVAGDAITGEFIRRFLA